MRQARPTPLTRRDSHDYYGRTQEARASGVTVVYLRPPRPPAGG